MDDEEQLEGLTKDHLYCVGTSATLRWQGIKGKEAFVEVATYDAPTVTIQSWKGKKGRIEFPVADIVRLRAGVEYMKTARYRCVISRHGAPNITLIGTMNRVDYRDLVLHLAEEMQGIGHFDRVERGRHTRWTRGRVGVCGAKPFDLRRAVPRRDHRCGDRAGGIAGDAAEPDATLIESA